MTYNKATLGKLPEVLLSSLNSIHDVVRVARQGEVLMHDWLSRCVSTYTKASVIWRYNHVPVQSKLKRCKPMLEEALVVRGCTVDGETAGAMRPGNDRVAIMV